LTSEHGAKLSTGKNPGSSLASRGGATGEPVEALAAEMLALLRDGDAPRKGGKTREGGEG